MSSGRSIYCFVDDLLKTIEHRAGSGTKFSDSEVVIKAVIAMLNFGIAGVTRGLRGARPRRSHPSFGVYKQVCRPVLLP